MRQAFRTAEFMCVQYVSGSRRSNIGVLLLDRAADHLLIQFAHTWEGFDDLEVELIAALGEDVEAKAAELGGARLIDFLLTSLSNTIRITDPQPIIAEDLKSALCQLAAEFLLSPAEHKTPLIRNAGRTSALGNTKTLIALTFQAGSAAARTVGDWVRSRQLASVAWCVASITCVNLALMIGVRAHRPAKTDLSQAVSARFLSATMKETPDTVASVAISPMPVSFPPTRPTALPIRKRLGAMAPRRGAPRLFVLPEAQRHRASKVAMVSLPDLQIQHVAIDAPSLDMAAEMQSLPASPKQDPGALLRVAKAIAYPFRKIGMALAE